MQAIVKGAEPFKCLKETFAIGPTSGGYTLNYGVSKDGPWTAWDKATPANETCVVNGVTAYMWFKLDGNADEEVNVIF